MTLECAQEPAGVGRGADFGERRWCLGAQVIEDDTDLLGLGDMHVHELSPARGKRLLGAAWGHAAMPPPLKEAHRYAELKLMERVGSR